MEFKRSMHEVFTRLLRQPLRDLLAWLDLHINSFLGGHAMSFIVLLSNYFCRCFWVLLTKWALKTLCPHGIFCIKKRHKNWTHLEIYFPSIPFQEEIDGELLARFWHMHLPLKRALNRLQFRQLNFESGCKNFTCWLTFFYLHSVQHENSLWLWETNYPVCCCTNEQFHMEQ